MDIRSSRFIFVLVFLGTGVSAQYDQCTGNTSRIGDGSCDGDNNNAACGYDGGDCCYCTCLDGPGFACDVFALDCRDPEQLGDEVSDCTGEHFADAPCSTEASTQWTVNDMASATTLTDAIRCSGGTFNVQWLGHVVVNRTISVANGTVLNITGVGTGAEIQASSGIRLFTVINSSLGIRNLRVTGGRAAFGGAIGADDSNIYIQNTSFSDNKALVEGGALYATFSSIVSRGDGVLFERNHAGGKGGALCLRSAPSATFHGKTTFRNNVAIGDAGALYAYDSNVTFGGDSVFFYNIANESGGALRVYSSSVLWAGDVLFLENNANDDGGALRISSSTVSWMGDTVFSDNMAFSSGGSLYVWDSTILWAGNADFLDNNGINGAGGALRVSSSTLSWTGPALFCNNTANESGGALRLWNSTVSWATNSTFSRNSANIEGGGALYARASSMSWAGHVEFSHNSANYGNGGALDMQGSTASWASDADFSNNTAHDGGGGALQIKSSSVSWARHAAFSDNTAKTWGGAMYVASSPNISWAGNTVFSDNTAESYGGALYVSSSIVSWAGDAEFSGNTANKWGGALYVSSFSNVSWMGETVFSHNTANDYGGGLYAREYSTASWKAQASFLSNTAGRHGGALYITDGARVLLELRAEFRRNSAFGDGGALYMYSNEADVQHSSVHIDGSAKFVDNLCGGDGGALVVIAAASVVFATQRVAFSNNSAHAAGGAVAVKGLVVGPQFTGLTFVSNHAQIGGAVYVTSSGTAVTEDQFGDPTANPTTFDGCKFIGNGASATGGALSIGAGLGLITNSYFAGNTARAGGALRLAGISKLYNCTFTENTSYDEEGAAISNVGFVSSMALCSFVDNTVTCEPGEFVDYHETNTSSSVFDVVCRGCDVECHQCVTSPRVPGCTEQLKHTKSLGGDTTLEALEIDVGYWRATNTSRKVLACYNPDACLGGVTRELNYCSAGYEGPYCSTCREGYSPGLGYICSRCSGSIGSVVVTVTILISAVAVALLLLFWIRDKSTGGGRGRLTSIKRQLLSFKIVIIVWQVTTQFTTVTNVTYPELYQGFLEGVGLLNFDLGWIISAECIIDLDFHHRLIISTIGPPVALAILGGMYATPMHRNRPAQDVFLVTAQDGVRQKYLSLMFVLTILIYTSVSSTLFRMFACDELDDGKSYLRADYRIDCNSPKHTWWQAYAGCMMLVYTGGIPALYGILLFRNRQALTNESARQEDARVKFISNLWELYKPNRYYYELIECSRRIMLAGMVVFIFPNTAAQVGVALMIATFFMVISEILAPYESEWDAWVNRMGHAIVFGSVYLALLLKIDVSNEREYSQRVFEVVLIAAHVCMLLCAMFGGVLITCQWIKRGR